MTAIVDLYGNALDDGEAGEHREPFGRVCGLHNPGARYYRHDVVSQNGSEWRAVRDDPGPLPGDGWCLGAKGSRGRPGERGKDGVHVVGVEAIGYCLKIGLSDGTTVSANLLPVLERFARERRKTGT
jgi:integrin beta 3